MNYEWKIKVAKFFKSPGNTGQTLLIVLDEIHKDRRWKRNLKGVYDTLDFACDTLVTGSARLNVYNKEMSMTPEVSRTNVRLLQEHAILCLVK